MRVGQPSDALEKLAGLGRGTWPTRARRRDGPDRIYVASDGKAELRLLCEARQGPVRCERGSQEALDDAIEKLPIPKLMSYQRPDGTTVKFARPVHRLLALHGADVVPVVGARP